MRLNRLHLSNFRQHVDTVIEFDPGLTAVIGPNGSGKTTILEAIAWALYGNPAARGTRDSIRSYRAGPRASVSVELDFELGPHRYVVKRGLNTAELFLDGGAAPVAHSITTVSDVLRRRLGMSHEEFFNTYFTGQKELSVMAAMGPAERAQFLSRVLGYERLRGAQTLVRDRRKVIIAESAGLQSAMPDPEVATRAMAEAEQRWQAAETRDRQAADRRDRARRLLDELIPQWERQQQERDALQAITAERRLAEGEWNALERDRERLDRELADAANARTELERLTAELAPLGALETELRVLDRRLADAARRRTLAEGVEALAAELVRMRDRKARIENAPVLEAEGQEELLRARAELARVQADFDAAQTDWVRDRQEAETKRQALLDQLRDVEQQRGQIVELGEDGICPTCARPLGDHFRSVLEMLDAQLETITVDGKYYRGRIDQLAQVPPTVASLDEQRVQLADGVSKLERRLTKVQLAVQELSALTPDVLEKEQRHAAMVAELATVGGGYDPTRHEDVRGAVAHLAPLATRASRLAGQLEREPIARAEHEQTVSQLVQAAQQIAELDRRRVAIPFSEESFASVRVAHEGAVSELRAVELAAVAAASEAASARALYESAQRTRAELAKAEAHLLVLNRDKRLHEELDRAYTDLRTDLNQQLRPEISELASGFLSELTDGRYSELELDENYCIRVLEDAVPRPVISGGEEDLANLVLRLAISQMIAERAGQSFSLLVLDEVFGSLDELRRHNVVDLLRRLQDRFEQVILITHIESVREGVDRTITVRYDEEAGSSRVESEPQPLLDAPEPMEQAGAAD